VEESTGQASANLICIDTTLPQMQQFQNLKNQFNMKLGQIKTVDPTALAEVTDAKLIVRVHKMAISLPRYKGQPTLLDKVKTSTDLNKAFNILIEWDIKLENAPIAHSEQTQAFTVQQRIGKFNHVKERIGKPQVTGGASRDGTSSDNGEQWFSLCLGIQHKYELNAKHELVLKRGSDGQHPSGKPVTCWNCMACNHTMQECRKGRGQHTLNGSSKKQGKLCKTNSHSQPTAVIGNNATSFTFNHPKVREAKKEKVNRRQEISLTKATSKTVILSK
jgi:hypothetical protein